VKKGGANVKDELNNNFRERILKAFIDIAVLARLEEKPANGYEITLFFHKNYGTKTSTSTVYATLYAMERKELVKGGYNRRSRVYELTEKGSKTLQGARNAREEMQRFIRTLIGS
jgi:DNA-binding PadR family transcriptional regulator